MYHHTKQINPAYPQLMNFFSMNQKNNNQYYQENQNNSSFFYPNEINNQGNQLSNNIIILYILYNFLEYLTKIINFCSFYFINKALLR